MDDPFSGKQQYQTPQPLPPPPAAHRPARKQVSPGEVKKELREAIQGSQEVLATATTAFPFNLFPDTITIDRTKVTITRRAFFRVAEVMSLRVEDILNVTANVGPFLGSLEIVSRVFNSEKPSFSVKYLWRKDVVDLKHILEGYVIALQQKIDCSALSRDELVGMLEKLGEDEQEK